MILTFLIGGLIILYIIFKNTCNTPKIHDVLRNLFLNTTIKISGNLNNFKSNNYPNYISEVLVNKTKMEELVENSYKTEFDWVDLRKIHSEIFEKNPDYLTKINEFKTKEVPREVFCEEDKPNFWIIEYDNLLFILNGYKMIPINRINNNVNFGWIFSLLFIPDESKIKSKWISIDNYFLLNNVINKITELPILNKLLNNIEYTFSDNVGNNIFGVNYYVVKSKLPYSDKLKLLFERDELPFLISVLLVHEDRISFDLDKLIYSLFNCEQKRFLKYLKLSESSQEIIDESELLEIIKSTVIDKETFLLTFQIELILSFLNRYNPKSIISKIKVLDTNFMSENSYNDKMIEIESELVKFKISYYQEIRKVIRLKENKIRVKKGFNLVGTYTQETILFEKLKTHFTLYNVVSQGSPKWLKLQKIDIYFPDLNIGVEYHGEQHFIPVNYFGGEEGLKKNIERDERKLRLCLENGCKLFVVDKDYNFEKLCEEIENEITIRKI